MERKYFPKIKENKKMEYTDLAIPVFGNRLYKDQTVYEYLIEFLLIFISPKENKELENGAFKFHTQKQIENEELKYFSNPRIGFKRFVFFDKAKSENKFEIDRKAYKEMNSYLKEFIFDKGATKEETLLIIKDLFFGFSAVLKNRAWFAQSLLPLVPEMILTESIGEKKERENLKTYRCRYSDEEDCQSCYEKSESFDWYTCDKKFNSNRHSFFARGGEVYYLHLLQGLNDERKEKLEKLLNKMLRSYPQFSKIANFIQNKWEDKISACRDNKSSKLKELRLNGKLSFIPQEYEIRANYTYKELENILSLEIDSLKKLELISVGMFLQIFRMMHLRVSKEKALWILDFCGSDIVKKYAINSYKYLEQEIEDELRLSLQSNEKLKNGTEDKTPLKLINESKENSSKLIRKIGKEINLIIPQSGPGMRMTLDEELVRFLVLSIVPPKKKIQFTTFLDKIFDHFGIVVGPKHFMKYTKLKKEKNALDNMGYFEKNQKEFEKLLRSCGFLRELSDATSIVENSYERTDI